MTHEPRTKEEIYESLKDSLTGKITKLSNFTERSFNYVWTQAFAKQVRVLELKTTVAGLSGWIDYTGGPITQDDLDQLDIDDITTPEEVNELMSDEYLDEYIKIVGISRLEGSRAVGEVTFQTQSALTEIPKGTRVTTVPDSGGDTIDFLTTEEVETADGVTTITGVQIQAVEVGSDFNLPANTIVRMADPPIGVSGVTNPDSTTGGEEEESNEDLRARAKTAVQSSSEGGTVDGIKGYIRQNIEGVGQGDIIIQEFTDTSPPKVDVIVDGGIDDDVESAIDFSRPTGIRHDLVRPQIVQLGFDISLNGIDINKSAVEGDITELLLEFGIGEDYYEDSFIRIVMTSDENIINIDDIGGIVERVTNESFEYDSTKTDYRLDYTYENINGTVTITDIDGNNYVENTDFIVEDQTGDGWPETVVWQGGATPDDGDKFFVDYDVTDPEETFNGDRYTTDLVRDEVFNFNVGQVDSFTYNTNSDTYGLSGVPFSDTVVVEDQGGTTYTKDTDWQLVPLDGADEETLTYQTGTTNYQLSEELVVDEIAIIDANGNIYERGVDYTMTDTDSDTYNDTIVWDDTASVPVDGTEFTVNYNGYPEYIRWDVNDSTPTNGDDFTATFDQRLYVAEYDVVETPAGEIRDASGYVYQQDTEYITTDYSRDGENDSVLWTTNPSSLDADEEFYFTYFTERDIHFGEREKADPGTINIGIE